MDSLIKNILNLSRTIKCRYPNLSLNEKIKQTVFHCNKEILEFLENNNTVTDCGSIIFSIILLNYYQNSWPIKDIGEITTIPNPKFHIFLPRSNVEYGNVYYLEYTPFYLLKKDYFDTGLIKIKTNSMGWWIIHLGKLKNYFTDYKDLWIGSSLNMEDDCYLYFYGKREDIISSMAISNLDFIKSRLVENAIKSWNNTLKEQSSIITKAYDGVFKILLAKNNISNKETKLYKTGSILLDLDKNIDIDIDKKNMIIYCNMCMNGANFYLPRLSNSSKLISY